MANAIDNATARIQAIALAMTSVSIKSAPDYPIENTDPLPMVVSYAGGGEMYVIGGTLYNFPEIMVEFHLSRVNLKQMQQQMNAIAYEFPARIAKDPTLNGTIDTAKMSRENSILYNSRPFEFDKIVTQMLLFTIPIKILQNPADFS